MTPRRHLVIGAVGQVGRSLVAELRARHGAGNVVAAGHRTPPPEAMRAGPFIRLDVTDRAAVDAAVAAHRGEVIVNLATLLSAAGEADPERAWAVNVVGLKNVLDVAVARALAQVFWPSSIAIFGPTTPRHDTPQRTVLEPSTMYGVTKLAGESLCNYYFKRHGLDVRSLRYPGILTHTVYPSGGTTDYSVEMFFEARRNGRYTCFVRADTVLPLMYVDDAIRATVELMEAPAERLTVRTSYNVAALSFSAGELAREVARRVPGFVCDFVPDPRQAIADSWPATLDDSDARRDWGWKERFDLPALCDAMLAGVDATEKGQSRRAPD